MHAISIVEEYRTWLRRPFTNIPKHLTKSKKELQHGTFSLTRSSCYIILFLSINILFSTSTPSTAPSSNFIMKMTCAPPISRNPLSFSSCRLAAADFLLAYADRHQGCKLTHRQNFPSAQDYIRCPCIISYHGCVVTLDFSSRFVGPIVRSWIVTDAAMTLARACVGKAGVDGGKVVQSNASYNVTIFLAHEAQLYPKRSEYANFTSGEGGGVGEGFLCGPLGPAFSID